MLMIFDYALFYAWVMFLYYVINKIGQKFSKSRMFKINKHDIYGMGIASLLMYMWLYTEEGYFIT